MRVRYPRRILVVLAAAGIGLLAAACGSSTAPAAPTAAPTQAPAKSTTAPQATAAPQAAAAPQTAQATNKLFITADIVQGTKNLPQDQAAAKTCVATSRFPRNAEVLWRARVIDPRTGNPMDDKALTSLEVRLADGKVIQAKYGKHSDDYFWVAGWVVPKDYPTGTVNFTLVATAADGRTGEFKPFQVAPSLLTITDEVLPDAVPTPTPAKKQ